MYPCLSFRTSVSPVTSRTLFMAVTTFRLRPAQMQYRRASRFCLACSCCKSTTTPSACCSTVIISTHSTEVSSSAFGGHSSSSLHVGLRVLLLMVSSTTVAPFFFVICASASIVVQAASDCNPSGSVSESVVICMFAVSLQCSSYLCLAMCHRCGLGSDC